MKFGHWLNSLIWIDPVVILFFFTICGWLAHLTMKGFRKLVKKTQTSPYAEEFRTSPFVFIVIAIPYTIILYGLIGIYFTELLKSTF